MPRKSKCTPEFISAFSKLIAVGMPINQAAMRLCIPPKTVYNWLYLGRNQKKGRYRQLYLAVEREKYAMIERALYSVNNAMVDNPRVAMWVLERLDPERWGPKTVIDIRATPEDLDRLPDEELEYLARLVGIDWKDEDEKEKED